MPLDQEPIEDVGVAHLQELVDGEVIEKKTLEYKRDLPGGTHSDRREFLRDVSSLGNTSGGHIIYGIREQDGRPAEVSGLTVADPGAETARLENILRDGLRPRLNAIQFGWVGIGGGRHALVIRVPSSWAKPHMVVFQEDGKFYARNANGKYAMDIDEIRTAFTSASFVATRAEEFRAERAHGIERGVALPVAAPQECSFAIHICPFSAFMDGEFIDLGAVDRDSFVTGILPPINRQIKFNLEGVQFYSGTARSRCLTVFRNGSIELMEPVPLNASSNAIFEIDFENRIVECVSGILGLQRRLGVNPPFVMSLTLLRARERQLNITLTSNRWNNGHQIDRSLVLVPPIRIGSFDNDLRRVLRPIFDGFWLAAGWPRSMNYNDAGEWVSWPSLDTSGGF